MAGMMMEKAAGKPYKQMVKDLGGTLGIDFEFGQPNNTDTL
jgi:CubicO group peptidase (beta-lactamase class C family)